MCCTISAFLLPSLCPLSKENAVVTPVKDKNIKLACEQFSSKVLAHRKEAGLSREKLAAETGVTYVTIRNIENGKVRPTLETVLRLSAALKINLGNLHKTAAG